MHVGNSQTFCQVMMIAVVCVAAFDLLEDTRALNNEPNMHLGVGVRLETAMCLDPTL